MTKAKKTPGFSEAMADVEDILRRLENDEVAIDDLGTEVKRAVDLVALCRDQLKAAEMEVQTVMAGLQSPAEETDVG